MLTLAIISSGLLAIKTIFRLAHYVSHPNPPANVGMTCFFELCQGALFQTTLWVLYAHTV
jgi:hypothetical protein